MVKYYKSGHAAVSAFSEHPAVKGMAYADGYARTRSMIKYSLILGSEGTVMPLPLAITSPPNNNDRAHGGQNHHPHPTANDIPMDLHEIFTNRLPDEIYFYLSRGLLGPQSLVWLTSGIISEGPPLDNGETTEYKRFVKEVITDGQTGPRATSLALISGVCHSFWSNRKIHGHFWFEGQGGGGGGGGQSKAIQHNSPQTAQLADRVSGWNVSYAVVEEELRRQNVSLPTMLLIVSGADGDFVQSSTIDFALCLGATASERLAARTKGKSGTAHNSLEKKDEVVANVIWRFLELRGYVHNTLSRPNID